MSTDSDWEQWGARDPYYGVLTDPKFRAATLTPEARREFFASGDWHVGVVLDMCRRYIAPAFAPRRVLDFGCGVGRVAIPFAATADEVVGVDVSPSMLAQALQNCVDRGVNNVLLLRSDDALSAVDGDFDLVHSCIVLQHVEVERGRVLFARLVDLIRPGGLGALHVTFGWDVYADSFGQPPPPSPVPPTPGRLAAFRASLRRMLGNSRRLPPPPVSDPAPDADPEMQMNYYSLSELMFILQRAGVQRIHTDITDHGGALGAFLFFQKPTVPVAT